MDALAFLAALRPRPQRIYVLSGDDEFLKRQVRDKIVGLWLGDADPDLAVAVYAGEKLDFSTVRNELDTVPFLAPCRLVIVEAADPFVTAYRADLEQYVSRPSPTGVLVLDVRTFPETTKLAKALPEGAKIACKPPPAHKLPAWCVEWSVSRHGKRLTAEAAELLVDRVGPTPGLLDQELAKLAVAAGARPEITPEDVERLVGRSRAADVFRILDAIGEGQPAEALRVLEELFAAGEDPLAIVAPLTAQLRRLAAVARFVAAGLPLSEAMTAAKVPLWDKARQSCERQLRHLGRRRLERLTEWLAELNLGLKGGSPLPERVQVERFVVRLARPRE